MTAICRCPMTKWPLVPNVDGVLVCGACLCQRETAGALAPEKVDHPAHYGGADDPYEAIKVIEAWGLGFNLGNTAKYIARAEKKGAPIDDLRKARFYLNREIANREKAGK